MDNNGYNLEMLYRHLDLWCKSLNVNQHYHPLFWRKHVLQENREEFSTYLKIKASSIAQGVPTKNSFNLEEILSLLPGESENWPISIETVSYNENKLSLKLSRLTAFRVVISSIIKGNGTYGQTPNLNLNVDVGSNEWDTSKSLTCYRVHLLEELTKRILRCAGYNCNDMDGQSEMHAKLKFTTKCKNVDGDCLNVYCGRVVGGSGETLHISAQDYISLREQDIRELSAHKYWDTGKDCEIQKLAKAAAIVDLIQAKPSNSVKIHLEGDTFGVREDSSKGAVFILYNYARIVSIRNKFEQLVSDRVCPPLPDIDEVNLSLLSLQDEWLILFNYLLEYPALIRRCVEKVDEGRVSPHNISVFTSKLCHAFSVYYRRARILLDSKAHLHETMFARLSLVLAIEHVLSHALNIMHLPTIDHM